MILFEGFHLSKNLNSIVLEGSYLSGGGKRMQTNFLNSDYIHEKAEAEVLNEMVSTCARSWI